MRKEWRDYGLFLLGAAVAAGVLAGLAAVTGPGVDDSPLWGPLAPVGIVAVTWLLGWPVWETARALSRAGAGSTAVR
ncbi:hypothetical protein E9549_20385 [Blastococcus sp. MG754426]|nr:hypothetical protein [Blastococcus sp. MG754426]